MPLKTGPYTMIFMINQGEPPFPISTDATMNITAVTPKLTGMISVPALEITNAPFEGTAGESSSGISFNFQTISDPNAPPTTQLAAYGMKIACGEDKKLMGGMNITPAASAKNVDPGEDACWVATHSVGPVGDDDDQHSKGRYGD
jgi:hypothetical protein